MSLTVLGDTSFINRTDVSTTVTASGNSGTLDIEGYGQISFTAAVTAISGSGAYIQFELQASDDGVNYNAIHDTRRMTTVDFQRLSGVRISSRYYRFVWFVGGSSPSIDITITSTFKDYSPIRTGSLFRYDDLDLMTIGATSTVFSAFSNSSVGCMMVRESDTSSDVILRLQASNDGLNWHYHTGDITLPANTTINREFDGNSHRFMRVRVMTAASGGTTPVFHALWNATGGA